MLKGLEHGVPYLQSCTVDAAFILLMGWMSMWSSPRPISTGQLHDLRRFHFRPINPLVWAGALPG